jgi:hypothetical protein
MPIGDIAKDALTAIPPRGDMVDATGELFTGGAGMAR